MTKVVTQEMHVSIWHANYSKVSHLRDDGIIDRQISNRTHATGGIFQIPKYVNATFKKYNSDTYAPL
jgi:hypothetical protein